MLLTSFIAQLRHNAPKLAQDLDNVTQTLLGSIFQQATLIIKIHIPLNPYIQTRLNVCLWFALAYLAHVPI